MPRPSAWWPLHIGGFRRVTDAVVLGVIPSMLLGLAAPAAFGAWPSSGLPLATGPLIQGQPTGFTAPAGDLQAFWAELAGPFPIRTQRLTLHGTIASGWPDGGRGVVVSPAATGHAGVTPDGAGGALLAWFDFRSAGAQGIYGIRVDVEGAVVPSWNPSGTAICTTSTAQGGGPINDLVRVCADGSGGAFVAWTDNRNTPPMGTLVYDVFAQHVLADGTLDPAWPAPGLALTGGSGYKYPHAWIADNGGGFWLVTENPLATSQLRVTHHSSDGSVIGTWITPSFATTFVPDAVSDGAGGVFVAWHDCRDCVSSVAIAAIRLGPGAQPRFGWPLGGVQLVASSSNLSGPAITATGDGAAVVTWLASGIGGHDRYVAQRIESNGLLTPGWPAGGRTFATTTNIFSGRPLIVPDGVGGAMFAFRRNTPNLFGSRVTSTGTVPPAFPDTGLSLCTLTGDQFLVSLQSDGLNGAYVLWEDRRDDPPNHSDIYAMRFTRDGEVGSTTSVSPPPSPPTSRIALSQPAPNPTFGSCSFRLSLPAGARVRVDVLDLSGRQVATVLDDVAPAGPLDLQWDRHDRDGRLLPPGIYVVRVRAGGESVSRRIVLLE